MRSAELKHECINSQNCIILIRNFPANSELKRCDAHLIKTCLCFKNAQVSAAVIDCERH